MAVEWEWVAGGLGLGTALGVLLGLFLAAVILWLRSGGRESGLRAGPRVLLVTAHPDDEAMFFGPTICGLQRSGAEVWLLCLSSGDFRKEGRQRKAELRRAAVELGIRAQHVTVVEHSKLPDHPTKQWPRAVVAEVVLGWVERIGASSVVTFDGHGVSGHRNHQAVFRGVQSLYSSGRLPVDSAVFVLESVWLGRKFCGAGDLAYSLRFSPFVFVADWGTVRRVWAAMRRGHASQMLWFRYLYLAFSRYVYLNSLRRMAPAATSSRASLGPSSAASSPKAPRSSTPPPSSSARPSASPASPTRRPLTARSPLLS